MRPHRRTTRHAFTLLEVLLATTVLALMTVLLAALGTQLRSWTEDGQRLQASMRLQRSVEAMREQWAGRVTISGSVEGLVTSPGYVSYLTSRPLLVSNFPVVRATYRWVERAGEGDEPVYDLMLEETPAGRIGYLAPERRSEQGETTAEQPAAPSRDREAEREQLRRATLEQIDNPAETWALLEGVERGGWERHGLGAIVLRNEASIDADIGPTSEYNLTPPDVIAEQRVPRWRAYDEIIPGTPRAVRLTGRRGKEAFTCVFVTRDSR
ncbi:MAG: type II secretion system protein [Phycisphaerales bacterium]